MKSPRMSERLVLCYHAIGESWSSSVSTDSLAKHVDILLRRGYEAVTFVDAVGSTDSRPLFAVTFDDAHASVLERAFPTLATLGVPATVFAVTSFAEDGRPLEWPELLESGVSGDPAARASLAWPELRRLAEAGWEIGSHTCTHPRLTRLDDESLEHELRASREACARGVGQTCRSIAYPYGDLDARVLEAAARAGYEAGCSLSVSTSGALAWPRIGVYGLDSGLRFRLKVSASVLRARRLLAARTPVSR